MVRHNGKKGNGRPGVLGAPKLKEREEAINLRRQGLTYSEILSKVPVAKSTLSAWLGEVNLTTRQKQRISDKKKASMLRGAYARKAQRVASSERIFSVADKRVGRISPRELWLLGVALYWGEGSKQKEYSPSTGVIFSNSDERMIKLFLVWLQSESIPPVSLHIDLYVHISRKEDVDVFKATWAKALGISTSRFERVYYKKGNLKTKRKNTRDLYKGLLRITVKASTDLNRAIAGAIDAIARSVT